MVMIPTDVGIHVRNQQVEPGLQPVRAVGDIPGDLPDLRQGQVFRARIQEVLPENTYKALVAGRSLTLALPEGAKAGDTLELVVIDRTPRAIVAQSAPRGAELPGDPYQQATLSANGRLIASLLPGDGQAAAPALLTRGRPVLAQVPANGAELARSLPAQLAQAVNTSGLFYEAHQVQWVLGRWPRASLLAEPQGEYSRDGPRAAWGLAALAEQLAQAAGPAAEAEAPAATAPLMPDDLRPLVQQQLEAAATQRLAWHGEIWPKQTLELEIQRDAPQADGAQEATNAWTTRLRLSLPRLGEIDARLHLNGQALRIEFSAVDAASQRDLRAALPALRQSLAAAGLTLTEATTPHGDA